MSFLFVILLYIIQKTTSIQVIYRSIGPTVWWCFQSNRIKVSKVREVQRLSSRKERIERAVGAGRRFKLVVKDRVIMVLVYYRLYITYTLMEFLFGLDQSNVCRDIQKIESMIRECLPIPQKLHRVTKRLKTKEEVEAYFPGFMFYRLYWTTNSKAKE